jgi:hypothetical protein
MDLIKISSALRSSGNSSEFVVSTGGQALKENTVYFQHIFQIRSTMLIIRIIKCIIMMALIRLFQSLQDFIQALLA